MPTNLPITANAPQTASQVARKLAGSNAPDDAQSVPGFMELLTKQLRGPQLKDAPDAGLIAAAIEKNAAIVPATDAAADDILAEMVPADAAITAAGATPAGMLAAMMLPQASAPAAQDSSSGQPIAADGVKGSPDLPAIDATAIDAVGKNLPVTSPASADKGEPVAAKPGQPAFAAMAAESALRAAGDAGAALRETPAIAAAAPPSPLASLQATSATLNAAVPQSVVQAAVSTPVGRERWGDEFSQRITWLTTPRQDQTAQLHLNPPQLGPLDVVLKVNGDNATALFTSPHAAVRDAIEQALPRLREMLADNGITLGNTTVSDQAPRESGSEAARRQASGAGVPADEAADAAEIQVRVSPIPRHDGIVDTFA